MDSTEWLRRELSKRKARNPAFSLRAFARLLEVQPGRLSEIIARKRPLTPKQIEKFAAKLAIHPKETAKLLSAEAASKATQNNKGQSARYTDLDAARFEVIAAPLHYHILSGMELDGFDGTAKWLANKLGSDVGEVRSALERLQTTGLVTSTRSRWKLANGSEPATSSIVPTAALRASHRASLQQSLKSLDNVALELRDISSITMAIDPSKLDLAKALLKNFRRQLASELESGDRSEVYELNIQLIPVSKVNKK